MVDMEDCYVQVYTGAGKGKTTAALGLGLRAAGRGLKILMCQFMKGRESGELYSTERIPNYEIRRFYKANSFFSALKEEERKRIILQMESDWARLTEEVQKGGIDLLILDEIAPAIACGLIPKENVLELIACRPRDMELVLTGRDFPQIILEKADLITEMKCIRHYYEKGIGAREGIEY